METTDNNVRGICGRFIEGAVSILSGELAGIYLHGSAVMGCYDPRISDIDLIVVVNGDMTRVTKRAFMDMTAAVDSQTPGKGLEMSVVRRDVCKPFVYPTPFELHFSETHRKRFHEDPDEYVRTMNGTDKDLAAHFTVIRARGECLYGMPVSEVFAEVPERLYTDSIWEDVKNAPDEIAVNTMYLTLNLARVLAWLRDKKILSKQEGGEWGLRELPERYRPLISEALREYRGEKPRYDPGLAAAYAKEMTGLIRQYMI